MAELHFLRPGWLLAIPIGLWLVWTLFRGASSAGAWRKVVDPDLQPHVLAAPNVAGGHRWPRAAAFGAVILCAVALAGPAWERVPVPVARDEGALVVALDLSRAMDVADVEPTRLARARLKLLSLLERRQGGQTALVVFSTHAFAVTPLTNDARTIASMINALSTDIMPTQGSIPASGLDKAGELLRQAGFMRGEVLLITGAEVSPRTLAAARDLDRGGFKVHVLGVGTEAGAPLPLPNGGFVTDSAGRIVIPRLDPRGLEQLAAAGGGRFALLTADDSDLDFFFGDQPLAALFGTTQEEDERADVWRDAGPFLALALLPIVALAFRRGWIAVALAVVLVPSQRAESSSWAELWQRADRQGYQAMLEADPERAVELFKDPEWRAAAQYRAGDYAASAATLEGLDTARALYNRGNALARSGRLEAAIEAYEQALALDPAHLDARYNRDLLEELLVEQQPEGGAPQAGADHASADDELEAPAEPADDASGPDGEREEPGAGDAGFEPPEDGVGEPGEPAPGEWPPDGGAEDGTAEPGPPPSAQTPPADDPPDAPGDLVPEIDPAEVEQWASEQAAEQWLRRIPQDPGGLLRRKFLYQYQRLGLDQDGNRIYDEVDPW